MYELVLAECMHGWCLSLPFSPAWLSLWMQAHAMTTDDVLDGVCKIIDVYVMNLHDDNAVSPQGSTGCTIDGRHVDSARGANNQ